MFEYIAHQIPFNVADMADQMTAIVQEDSFFKKITSASLPEMAEKAFAWSVSFAGRLLAAAVVFVVLRWFIRRINRHMLRNMERHQSDKALVNFVKSFISIVLNTCMVLIIIMILGVQTSSIMALMASAGVAIGLALSGTLQNFAGGVMILLQKPFQLGDYIEAQGQAGYVKEIQIVSTIILTLDNKTIYIPNGALSTGVINNYSRQDIRRIDWTFSIAYGDNYDKAKAVLQELLDKDVRVLKEPAYFIALSALADSSVKIVVRAWSKTEDFWAVFYDLNEKVYRVFAQQGLNIPFPQLDVHVTNK